MNLQGCKNSYTCDRCGASFVTVDRDEGITPFMTNCVNYPECKGTSISAFYRVDQTAEPTHEWYRPDRIEYGRLSLATKDHVNRGGLLLRRIQVDAGTSKVSD